MSFIGVYFCIMIVLVHYSNLFQIHKAENFGSSFVFEYFIPEDIKSNIKQEVRIFDFTIFLLLYKYIFWLKFQSYNSYFIIII